MIQGNTTPADLKQTRMAISIPVDTNYGPRYLAATNDNSRRERTAVYFGIDYDYYSPPARRIQVCTGKKLLPVRCGCQALQKHLALVCAEHNYKLGETILHWLNRAEISAVDTSYILHRLGEDKCISWSTGGATWMSLANMSIRPWLVGDVCGALATHVDQANPYRLLNTYCSAFEYLVWRDNKHHFLPK